MDVQLPDGTTIQGVPEGTTKAQLAEKLKASGRDVPESWLAPSARKTPKQMKIGREGFGEAFGQVLEEATPFARKAAAFGSFPRQLYEGAKQRLGMGDPEAIRATRMLEQREPGAALAGGVATMVPLSMIPGAGTVAGQAALGGATGALTPTESGESVGKNIALSTLAGGVGGVAMKGLGMAARPIMARGAARAASLAEENAVRDETVQLAHQAGLRIPASAVRGGEIAEQTEGIGMRGAVARDFSRFNQPKINAIAREEAGITGKRIDEKTLAEARNRISEPYREVERLASGHPLTQPPFKDMAGTLKELKQQRADATKYWRHYERSLDPNSLDIAQAADNKADLLEQSIETVAKALGRDDLVPRLRAARVQLAKNYDVERALNLGSGNVDAKYYGRLIDRKGLNAVTGGSQIIGRVAKAFPSYVNEGATGTSRATGYGILKPTAAVALGLGGYGASEHFGFGPWGAAAAAVPLLSGPARAIALSKLMQGAPTYSPGMAARLTGAATGPLAQRLIPLSSVAGMQTQP